MSLSTWFRVIRVKFLLASVIAVSLGLAVSYWQTQRLDVVHSIITMAGVLALHASVDLLNDFWDYKRGIDTTTKRTKFSGGTGVLPEGLLEPSRVYRAGVIFLILGSLAGIYFIVLYGWIIAAILGFAVLSIYFYSTKIVDSGLGEIFVGIKGTMIVLGTIFIQTQSIEPANIVAGVIAGTLSSFVLYITSFPDYEADKQKGRRTLVIVLGKNKASVLFWVFPAIVYGLIIFGVSFGILPVFCLVTFATIPLVGTGAKIKKTLDDAERFVSIMKMTLVFSRITGMLLIVGFLIEIIKNAYS
ncbi:prenyltransferase [Candidatus Parcubacteria bacterium]|nr:MAG: prenyltransferase [Candidatus Parcubacteria bacterium]